MQTMRCSLRSDILCLFWLGEEEVYQTSGWLTFHSGFYITTSFSYIVGRDTQYTLTGRISYDRLLNTQYTQNMQNTQNSSAQNADTRQNAKQYQRPDHPYAASQDHRYPQPKKEQLDMRKTNVCYPTTDMPGCQDPHNELIHVLEGDANEEPL